MREIKKLILHCSATPEGREVTVEQIDKWHKQRGFNSIGYHYVIYLDGSIHKGREEEVIGAHCTGQNKDSIGVCYVGGMDAQNKTPKDTRTDAQKESLIILVHNLIEKYELTIEDVYGHYQFANKACPSFDVEEFKKELTINI